MDEYIAGFEEHVVGVKKDIPVYLPIHTIPPDTKCDCPNFVLEEIVAEDGKRVSIAKCSFLNRFLTRSQVEKCVRYWSTCPFYLQSIQVRE